TPLPTSAGRGPLQVAYLRRGDLWLWSEDAPARALTQTGDVRSVRLSDDGQLAAYERALDAHRVELWAVSSDGGDPRRLLSVAALEAMRPRGLQPAPLAVVPASLTWAPGAHSLAFNTAPVYDGLQVFAPDDLQLVDAATGQAATLLPPGQGGEFIYAPDGGRILLLRPDGVSMVDANGGNRRDNLLPQYQAVGFGEYYRYPPLVWAADGRSLLAALPASADPYSQHEATVALWRLPAEGGPAQQLATITAFPPSASLSPDGAWVAYWRTPRAGSNQRELRLAAVDSSSDLRYLTGHLTDFLGWAPDSQHFVFRYGQGSALWLGHPCAAPRPLTDAPAAIGEVKWVNPGRFLFVAGQEGAYQLRLGAPGAASQLVAESETTPVYDFAFLLVPLP
ncbi:MAG: hypothetical protein HY784_12055, partial [Chloroflexi bacterium]|nr:hypothetical protein [Chloroflexota bacterium]